MSIHLGVEEGRAASETPDPAWLLDHRRDVYSQYGEDGIVARALELIPDRAGWCVELGASDGIYLSNTRHLILEQGYSAVLIEGDRARAARLRENYASNPRVTALDGLVGFGPHDSLDAVLRTTAIPSTFDFLSIDIDGNDVHVWRALRQYTPKLVCIEFNPTIPPSVHFEQPADPAVQQGSSLEAITALAGEKGYELVSVLPANAFFVQRQWFGAFGISDNRPQALRRDLGFVTYLFSGYDGSLFLRGNRTLPWHGLPLSEERLQVVPRLLRRYPSCYGTLERVLFALFRRLRKSGARALEPARAGVATPGRAGSEAPRS